MNGVLMAKGMLDKLVKDLFCSNWSCSVKAVKNTEISSQ